MKFLYPRKYLQVKNNRYLMESIPLIKYENQTIEFEYQGNQIQIAEVLPSDIEIKELIGSDDSLLALIDQ